MRRRDFLKSVGAGGSALVVGGHLTMGVSMSDQSTEGDSLANLSVDCSEVVGEIRSLIGVNRGPYSFARREGQKTVSHLESYRNLGIDFIRTHDFYGPTDWHVIFPDWSADAEDPDSYDFESSDVRIKAIVENGFRCFFRLGTSWKGRREGPINDPPGTLRDSEGEVVHAADRDDCKKWAQICVQTMRHYLEGWKEGYSFPIEYWEIWNEPDLAAQFWTGTPEQFYTMYEEASRAIKATFPQVKVGGPACTGAFREPYVEGFIRHCSDHELPLDFFTWHSYGGRGGFNPYRYYQDARRMREALDGFGYQETENINTEWNAGIRTRLFNHTPAGAAFYASTMACMLDAGVKYAFQYCGDSHPGLGLHDRETGEPMICGYAFLAWKKLIQAPVRVAATGSDKNGYNIVAGKDAASEKVRILISDYQSDQNAFQLHVANLPWEAETNFQVTRFLLDEEHNLTVVEDLTEKGREFQLERPFKAASVCMIEINRKT